jgi:AcrR family transcriptional regulator
MTQEERKRTAINNILDSAEEYIQKNGVNNIDINKICKSAGLTKGAFYHHFRNKQHLLLSLFNRWIVKVSSEIELTEYKDTDPVDLIIQIIDSISPAFIRSTNQLPMFLELYIKAINDKKLKKYVVESYNSFISFFLEVLKNGMDRGLVKKGNPVQLSKILFSLTLGLLIQGLINPDSENWQKIAKKSVSLILSK